ncbi:PREDICTED: uncharacterized protein LOC105129823 [Populus euphratica]|uniref:Uncharacterized protein LOC105129823 n=1 Tax=Populus euphratica TaxID=75702 RepID=A0AAJ6UII6_POPEU|nr:PREDICTED: uncharacterized protein LOC105129823 [Populus euphratica]
MSGTLTPRTTALVLALAVCVEIPTVLSGSTGLCAADSASVAMPRKLDSSSTAEEDGVIHRSRWVWNKYDLVRIFMFELNS